ncbi:MAG: hypothetical protein ACOC2W_00840 [bacterium]
MKEINICPICKKIFSSSDKGNRSLKRHLSSKNDIAHQYLSKLSKDWPITPLFILYNDYFNDFVQIYTEYGKPKIYEEIMEGQIIHEEDEYLA